MLFVFVFRGCYLLVGNPVRGEIITSSMDHTVRVWDMEFGRVLSRLTPAGLTFSSFFWSC